MILSNCVLSLIRNELFCPLYGMLYLTSVCFSSVDMVLGFSLLPNSHSAETELKNCNTDDFFSYYEIYICLLIKNWQLCAKLQNEAMNSSAFSSFECCMLVYTKLLMVPVVRGWYLDSNSLLSLP